MDKKKIGQEMLEHAKTEGMTVRSALHDLFPYIYAVSGRMSLRKISEWLEEKHDVKISFTAIGKAVQKSDGYIQETASKFYGTAAALEHYLPDETMYGGLDVLASRALFDMLRVEDPFEDGLGHAQSILIDLEGTWFALPEKYRDACMAVMRKQKNEERGKASDATDEG